MPLGHIYWDTKGNGIDCCPNVVRFFGLNTPQEVFENWDRLSPPYQPNGHLSETYFRELMALADVSGKIVFEWQHQTIHGDQVLVEVMCVRHCFNGNETIISSIRDLRDTIQCRSGASMKVSWLASVLRSCPICFALLSGDQFAFVTPFMSNFLGAEVGDSFISFITDPVIAEMLSDPQEDEIISWIPVTIRTRYGDFKEMLAYMLYFDDSEGDSERIVWLIDVTQSRKLERELKTAKDLAEANTKAKSDFLAAMSHEIRTPMNAITGLTHLALRTALTEQQTEYIETVQQSAHILLRLINDILDFSKIEAGRLTLEYQEFSIESIISDISAVLHESVQNKGLDLQIIIANDLPVTVMGDSVRLHQVILNLLTNSIKFTEQGAVRLTVEVAETDALSTVVRFSVMDTGIGMTPLQVNGLFKPFSQASVSTTRRFGGTGLGLAISKQIVELMHGEITCHSAAGEGTTFVFTARFGVPLEGEIVDIEEENEIRTDVLLVGDCPQNQMTMRHYIELLNAKVYQIGAELSELKEMFDTGTIKEIDLIIFDFADVKKCFVPLHTALSNERLTPSPICVITEHPELDSVLNELNIKHSVFTIPKPIVASDLFNAVTKVVAEKEAARQKKKKSDKLATLHDSKTNIPDSIRGAKILLAEDNKINQMVARELLKVEGFEVTVADNGRIAVEMLQHHEFDLVLMDIQMPEMDGFEATRLIRSDKRFADLPILAMTANAMANDRELSLAAGMNDHISKPIDPKILYRALVKWIRK